MKTMFNFLKKIWTSSIRRQLMMGMILVHAVLMSIFVYDLVERQRAFLHTQSENQAKSLASTLAVNSASWVLASDVVGLEEILSAQNNYPGLRYAMVLSPNGKVLGHTEVEKVGLFVNDAISGKLLTGKKERQVLLNDDFSVDIASPIFSSGAFIGWARVNLTQEDNAKNLQVITRDGVLYTVLAIFIGALFAFFMAKGITRGLKHIVDVAEGIKQGNLQLRSELTRKDELGHLSDDFNLMLDTIEGSRRDLQMIMDNSPAVIYAKDIEGRYIFINQKWADLFDSDKKGAVGKTDYQIFDKEFAEKFRENDLDVLNVGHPVNSEEVAPHEDGPHTYVTVKFPLKDESGKSYAICGISTDITDNIKIKNEKSFLEKQLLHTQKIQAIGQLTGGVAHDFNNLLAVILGYTELSSELFAQNNEQLKSYLKEIETAGKRGRDLILQMMIYSRKDQNQNDLAPMNIKTILEETIGMLRATFPSGIDIETSIEKNIPSVTGNSGLVSQVLMNLCINAKDSMGHDGKLLLALSIESFKDSLCHSCQEIFSGDYVVINVKDNGEGIDDEELTRIFEPFYTSKNVGEGTGMGLSVVHGVVHKLGGHIIVDSIVGEGTSFKILLPASKSKVELESNKAQQKVRYDFSGLNIMVIDDEPAVSSLLEASLKQCNATVEAFTSSELALSHFKENSQDIDLVITDQTMPDLTGVELSEKLLAHRSDTRIILCTGFSADVTEESALALGIKAFIYKPLEITKLCKVINELK